MPPLQPTSATLMLVCTSIILGTLAEVPWTVDLYPKAGECVPNPEHNALQVQLSLEVLGNMENWMKEHEGDEVCLEYVGELGDGQRVCEGLLSQSGHLTLPPMGITGKGESEFFEVLATIVNSDGTQVAFARSSGISRTDRRATCNGVKAVPSSSSFPPMITSAGSAYLSVTSPRLNDVVHSDSAILSLALTQANGSIWDIKGSTLCIGYTVTDLAGEIVLGSEYGCLEVSG